jgi:DnaK suppressor protein
MDESRARELLVAERAEVAQLLRETESAATIDLEQDDGPGDSADAAQPLEAQADEEAVAERLRERLGTIDRALGRIEAGTYGKSLLSGQPIPAERLEADPAAELTIEEARTQHG